MRKERFLAYLVMLSLLLGIRDGYIALWKTGEKEPVQVFPYQVSSLPPADQERLREGIVIESKEELISLIEDYFS